MTPDILLALITLAGAVVALATGVVRADVVALVIVVLVISFGLVSYGEALAGFANPAVIEIAGMFVISAGLSRTGVAELLGRWLVKVAGPSETRILTAVTLASGALSGFINNIAVAAMMLPVVVTVARQLGLAPSRLLIPMAIGVQVGGFLTLIGSFSNLLAADALRSAGFEPFGLLSYTPLGVLLLIVASTLVIGLGPRVLPARDPPTGAGARRPGIRADVNLGDRLFVLAVPDGSYLSGKTLAASLIGSALGVHVLAIERREVVLRAPDPATVLEAGDRIVVQGHPDRFLELRGGRHIAMEDAEAVSPEWLVSPEVGLARARVSGKGGWAGRSPAELDLKVTAGIMVLSLVRRGGVLLRTHLVDAPLEEGDIVLLQGPRSRLEALTEGPEVEDLAPIAPADAFREFGLADRLWSVRLTSDSVLDGRRLEDTHLGDAAGLLVLAVARPIGDGGPSEQRGLSEEREASENRGQAGPAGWDVHVLPGPDFSLRRGDHLMVKARPDDLAVLRALQRLEIDVATEVDPALLEGGDAGFTEALIAPHSALVGKTLRQIRFRERFGLHVVAIVREGEIVRTNLRDHALRFGDALLLYGGRREQRALAAEPDLIPLHSGGVEAPDFRLAPRSLFVTFAALVPVVLGWVPVPVGVLAGAVLMVLSRCLAADEAYNAVHFPSIVLVAGMLALGTALAESGVQDLFGSVLLDKLGGLGPFAVLVGLVLVGGLAAQVLPGAALVVLLAPIAIQAAAGLGASPYPFVMAVGIASTSVASPFSTPALAITQTPGGYRPMDYVRLGLPVSLAVLLLVVLVTPILFPF
jgi:di/tricarboxylate transporter